MAADATLRLPQRCLVTAVLPQPAVRYCRACPQDRQRGDALRRGHYFLTDMRCDASGACTGRAQLVLLISDYWMAGMAGECFSGRRSMETGNWYHSLDHCAKKQVQVLARRSETEFAGLGLRMEANHILNALRVLVVEDETLIALLLEDMIAELGAIIVGPFSSLADALAAVRLDNFDVALIDMNLRGERADEVARRLAHRRVPFALMSGNLAGDLSFGETTGLQKPFTFRDIEMTLKQLSSARGQGPGQSTMPLI